MYTYLYSQFAWVRNYKHNYEGTIFPINHRPTIFKLYVHLHPCALKYLKILWRNNLGLMNPNNENLHWQKNIEQ